MKRFTGISPMAHAVSSICSITAEGNDNAGGGSDDEFAAFEAAGQVVAGGDYIISSATFPDYFYKDKTEAALAFARLDATIFAARIAPSS